MNSPEVDLERYFVQRVRIRNAAGGRGYDLGIRTFDCPFCADTKARGWVSLERWSAGCWNGGCPAEPRLLGGVVEWIGRVENLSRRAVWRLLFAVYHGAAAPRPRQVDQTHDWVKFPSEMCSLSSIDRATSFSRRVEQFLARQWSLSWDDAVRWHLGVCWRGFYARRVIIPVEMPHAVGFQARTLGLDVEPKYRTSAYGTECGRRSSAMLFNLQPTLLGVERLLVEGAGDVMGWHRGDRDRRPQATGLLGMALTPVKMALLAQTKPTRVIVGVDNEPAAQQRAAMLVQDLLAWGFVVDVKGTWVGGKDAGGGADLQRQPLDAGPVSLVASILRGAL